MQPVPAHAPPIGSPGFQRDRYRTYRALLDEGVRVVRLSPHVVALTHYRDCLDTLRDPRLSAKRYVRPIAHFSEEQKREVADWRDINANMMFFMDPPDHTRVRKLLARAFSVETIAAMVPRLQAVFDEILDEVPVGVEFDFMRRVAHRFPALVIGEILGVPRDNWDRLTEWSDIFLEFLAGFESPFELALRANQASIEMREYMRELAAFKRTHPADDVISFMVHAEEDGDALSGDEMLAQCNLLLVAGHETTRNLIANGLLTLLKHPAEMERLRNDPSLVRSATEEFLRFEAPVQGTSRVAVDDVDIYGEKVGAGQSILPLFGCANRDPRQFPDPDRFDPARKNNAHLTFGAGAHACLGLHLARIETQIAIPTLLRRYAHIELREDDPPWLPTLTLRGLRRLNVVLR